MEWLFLRGLTRDQRHWENFPKLWEQKISLKPVHFLDLPGTGTEYLLESPVEIERIVEDLRARWRRKSIQGPVSILAISMGAMIAVKWAESYPEDIDRLVLVNTSAKNSGRFWERIKPLALLRFVGALGFRKTGLLERCILDVTTNTQTGNFSDPWKKYFCERPWRISTAINQVITARKFSFPDHLEKNILFLASRKDRLVDYRNSVRLAAALGKEIKINPTAGHDIFLDDPQWVVDQVFEWNKNR